jgi:hypothetical protein
MKIIFFTFLLLIPGISYSQWIIDNSIDDFDQNKRVYSNSYDQGSKGECTYPTVAEILPSHNLEIYTNCHQNGQNWWYITLIVDGQPKEYIFTGGSSTYSVMIQTPPTARGKASTVLFCNALKDASFYMDFAKAAKMSIKINCFPYETNYFSMTLNPKNTVEALNFLYDGEFSKMENERIKQDNLVKEKELQKETQKQNVYELLISNITEKKIKEAKANFNSLKALLGYDLSEKKYADLEFMILDQEKKNIQEIEKLVNEKNIDAAIDLIKITSDEPSILNSIKLALIERFPNPTSLLSSSELNDFLQGSNEKLSSIFKQNTNQELTFLVKSDGTCELKNVKGEFIHSFKCAPQYIAEIDYRGIKFNVDSKYNLKIEVDCGSAKVVGINLGSAFSKDRMKIESGEIQFLYTADKDGTLVLLRKNDGTDYDVKDELILKINEVKVLDSLIGKKARFVRSCSLKVNGYDFTNIDIESDIELTRFKKIK